MFFMISALFLLLTNHWKVRNEGLCSLVGWRKVLERMTIRQLQDGSGSPGTEKDLFEKLTRKMLVALFLFPKLPKYLVLHAFLQWGLWIYMVGLEVGEFLKSLNCLGNVSIYIFSALWWKESGIFSRSLRGSVIQKDWIASAIKL